MNKKCLKAINFDLDTKKLKQYYPNKNYRQAYKDIKKFLVNNGFKHRQFSGYMSQVPMGQHEAAYIISTLADQYPWLSKCARRFDVTDIGKEHDMMKYINTVQNEKTLIRNSPVANKSESQQNQQKKSLLQRLDEKKLEVAKSEKSLEIGKSKNNDIEI